MRKVLIPFQAYWCVLNGLEKSMFFLSTIICAFLFLNITFEKFEGVRMKNIVTTTKMSCVKQPAMYFLPIKASAVN